MEGDSKFQCKEKNGKIAKNETKMNNPKKQTTRNRQTSAKKR